jgi:hypothetical protein
VIENPDVAAIDRYAPLMRLDILVKYTHDGVILEQVGQCLIVGKVIDADNFNIGKGFIHA